MRRLAAISLLACLLTACHRKAAEPPEDHAAAGGGPEAGASGPTGPGASLTPASIAPTFTIDGGGTRIPESVIIQFARPVPLRRDEDGNIADTTSIDFDPGVKGSLEQPASSTLKFTPSNGFEPGTKYEVTLESVDATGNVLRAPEGNPWRAEFTTPEFAMTTATLVDLTEDHEQARVAIAFTGPASYDDVAEHAHFTDGLQRLQTRAVMPQPDGATILVDVLGSAITPGSKLKLELDRGVRLVNGRSATAPSATATMDVLAWPQKSEVAIRGASPAEGTNGFYVEVVCDDASVKDKRWYWDPNGQQGYDNISTQCRPDAQDLAEKLRFDPPVAFTTSPGAAGFRVFGDFHRGSYAMHLEPGVRTSDGGVVRQPFDATLSIPARKPRLEFTTKGRYLPRDQWRSLPFRHLNVDSVDVVVRQVRPEDLVFWASADEETTSARDSDVLAKTKLAVRADADQLATGWLDVASLVPPATRGLLEVTLSAGEATDSARLVLTDIQLVAKREEGVRGAPGQGGVVTQGGDVRAWAFESESLSPIAGVQVDLVRPSGQVVTSGVTDTSGEVRLRMRTPSPDLGQEPPFGLIARKGNDLTYLAFDEVKEEVDDELVGGESSAQNVKWHAALFTDRGVYRPGETVHAVAIVRDAADGPAKEGMPVTLRIVDPRGRALRETTVGVSASGFATMDVPLADYATTGRHELQLDVATERVAAHRFHVEEFVPERMKVEVAAKTPEALVGDPVTVTATARYLFGSVPVDHRAELTCTLEPGNFAPASQANYHFGPWRQEGDTPPTITLGTSSGVLDQDGKTDLSCPTSESGSLAGPGRVVASVAVFEAGGGRATIGQATATLHPERFAIGLSSRTAKAKSGEPISVEGVVSDWQGKLLTSSPGPSSVKLTLLRLEREYGWWYDEGDGSSSRRNFLRAVPEGSVDATVSGGRFTAQLTPQTDAVGYLVRASAGRATSEVQVGGAWEDGWWEEWGEPRADRTPRPGKPEWLVLKGPEIARVGKEVEVRFDAPHRGRVLFTAEGDRVFEREWKDVEAGPVTWSFTLDEFRPNVYVTALLLKPPHLESRESFVPDRAYGLVSIPVEPTAHLLPLKLGVPKEIRSNEPLTVTVDAGRDGANGQVVVAAIDEGILSLTKFESPDPNADLFARRALGVQTYETVGWTMPAAPPPPGGAGSGDEALALGRVQSIKPVALWSGLVDLDASGKAKITFQVPTYRGQLRVMAVAATPKRSGSASEDVIVRDPLTLEVTLPRFLVENDVAQVPVFVTNVSGSPRSVAITLTSEALDVGGDVTAEEAPNLVKVAGDAKTISLKDGESGTALFTLRTKGRAGAVRLTALASAGDLHSTDEIEVPIEPAGPRTRTLQRIELQQGDNALTTALQGWEPMSERTTIRVTSNPYADVLSHVDYLVHYPYGCIEQTTSTGRPLLALQSLAVDVDPKLLKKGSIEDMVRATIARIDSMQLASGGFGYWPGDTQEAYWGSAYATHFLLDAKQAGYVVSQQRLDAALTWMEDRITNHFEKGRHEGDWYSKDAEPYFHYVLARAGRARTARAESLLQSVPGDSAGEVAENRFLLQAALWIAGNRKYEKELRAVDSRPITDERKNDWTFWSDRRRRGLELALRTEMFGADAQGEKLAAIVADGLRAHESRWYTTQEIVWGLWGLSKFSGAGATFAPPTLVAGGREIAAAPQHPGAPTSERTFDVARASERGAVIVNVPQKGEGKLWAIVASEGVRKDAPERVGGDGLELSREFLDGSGAPAPPEIAPPALGDVVQVVLTISNKTVERIANVALVDRVASGFEIENPRLGRGEALDWLSQDDLWQADHVDIRDDRIEVFGALEAGETKKVAYSVRAVTPGRFTLPSAEAEAMYDPTVWARTRSSTVRITGPWGDVAQ